MTSIEERRRRARYRAAHRGTREMDLLLGRYAETAVAAMSEAELTAFEQLLTLPDPSLQAWIIMGDTMPDTGLEQLVSAVRRFHGLGSLP